MTRPMRSTVRCRRIWLGALASIATLAIAAPLFVRGPTLILWNASASVPEGLYRVQPGATLRSKDLAVVRLPTAPRTLAADRQYLPRDVLLIKPIAALGGSTVCRHGLAIYVDNVHAGDALPYDDLHRPMPDWQGCHTLSASEIFLMNPAVRDSFDGRYFGVLDISQTRGRAVPLLTFHRYPRT